MMLREFQTQRICQGNLEQGSDMLIFITQALSNYTCPTTP